MDVVHYPKVSSHRCCHCTFSRYESEGMSSILESLFEQPSPSRRYEKSSVRAGVPGWLGSLALHLLFVVLFVVVMRTSTQTQRDLVRLVPINIIRLGDTTSSPSQERRTALPQQKSPVEKTVRRNIPGAISHERKPVPPDGMEMQLRALARLREPETSLPVLDNTGASDVDSTSTDAAPGTQATYSVKDFVRNQVERRWSLNFSRLGGRNYVVLIHIELKRNGTITKAEIADKARFTTDATYRDVALSARNAVLLSSPITLPAGKLEMPTDITLQLNPKDTLR